MPKIHSPRHSSLQVRPRVRAKRQHADIKSWAPLAQAKPLGFAGYKTGMTRILAVDNRAESTTKGIPIAVPCTIIECPPLKVWGIASYKYSPYGAKKTSTVLSEKLDKELARTIVLPKQHQKKSDDLKPELADEFRLIVHTQPGLTSVPKKKPEVFEIALGGKKEEQLVFAKDKLGKELLLQDVFIEGEHVDCHSITKGKGFQGATKRHHTTLRQHKAEKGQRGPANVGSWTGNRSWTVAHPGQMGYHQRMEHNKLLIKMSQKPEEVNPKGGFVRYGLVKNQFLLIKGSVGGPKKRLIKLSRAIRPNRKIPSKPMMVQFINRGSQQ